jgi:hypothetical protein
LSVIHAINCFRRRRRRPGRGVQQLEVLESEEAAESDAKSDEAAEPEAQEEEPAAPVTIKKNPRHRSTVTKTKTPLPKAVLKRKKSQAFWSWGAPMAALAAALVVLLGALVYYQYYYLPASTSN